MLKIGGNYELSASCLKLTFRRVPGVVSPANPLYTPKEIANQLRDSGACLAIVHEQCLKRTEEAIQIVQGEGSREIKVKRPICFVDG